MKNDGICRVWISYIIPDLQKSLHWHYFFFLLEISQNYMYHRFDANRWERKTLLIWTSCSSEGPSKGIYKYNAKQGLPGHLFVKQLKSSLQDCFVD